jgi:hypothetical protein
MARNTGLRALGFALVAVWTAACGGTGADGDVELQTGNLETTNALTANALTANALTANALTANALTANALTANALTANALTANGLKDPLSRMFMKYVVSCALPEEQTLSMSIDGKTYKFPGSLGLAPQWGKAGGKCDESCQRWVSACVLSRVDFLGVEMPISIRGVHPALRVGLREFFEYTDDEATYFGNVLTEDKEMYACLAPNEKQIERVCGDSIANCPMKVVGSCAKACTGRELSGGFMDCSSSGKAKKPETFRESVTVFLPKSGR